MAEMSLISIGKKEKVADMVLAQIKDSLLRGEIRPGDKLPGVNELSAKLGVGISSVREAIKMLEILGAVECRQGEGTFVCSAVREGAANAFEIQFMLLPRTAEQLAQFREFYETAYTNMALDLASPEDLDKVRAAVEALEAKARDDPDAPMDAKDELAFHRAILYCARNPYVIKIGEVSLELFFDALAGRIAPLRVEDALRDHRDIYAALRDKDREKLNAVLGKSFKAWLTRFGG